MSSSLGLNENQERAVLVRLAQAEHLLMEADALLSRSEVGLFQEHSPVAVPGIAPDYQNRLREFEFRLKSLLREACLVPPRPRIAARWAARTNVLFASNYLNDLRPERFRGFGEVTDPGRDWLNRVVANLQPVLSEMLELLSEE